MSWEKDKLFAGMTCTGFGFGTLLSFGWFWPRSLSPVYLIYRGVGTPLNIDFSSPVASTIEKSIVLKDLTHLPSTVYYYAVRKRSIFGISDYNLFRVVEVAFDEYGELEGLTPGPPTGLKAVNAPNGAFDLEFEYWSVGEMAFATNFNAYEGPTPGMIDYSTPVGTLQIRRGQVNLNIRTLDYPHNSVHYFVVRAVSEEGVEEKNENYVMGVSDAEAPDKLSELQVR